MTDIHETPSLDEVQEVLASNDFEYQRVNLPYGLYTPGDDRTPTRDRIFPSTLSGASLLDIGSANGFFCFEAEKRQAGKVVGIELKDKRFQHALILKKLLRSAVDFRQQNVIEEPLSEQFDFVLFLNVLHHLKEPMHALRKIAAITRQQLIIEIPMLTDPKFRRTMPFWSMLAAPLLNRLPLMGVSSLADPGIDQSFVFTPRALKQALTDHEPFFSSIEVQRSPIAPSRCIMICKK